MKPAAKSSRLPRSTGGHNGAGPGLGEAGPGGPSSGQGLPVVPRWHERLAPLGMGVVAVLAGLTVVGVLARALPFGLIDFEHYYRAGRVLWQGDNPYGTIEFFAPPWLALIIAPLLLLPLRIAAAVWLLINIGATALSVFMAVAWLDYPRSRAGRVALTAAVVLAPAALFVYITGQLSALVGLGLLAGAWSVSLGQPGQNRWLAAAGLVAATLKPHVAALPVLLLVLELLRRREWRPLRLAAVVLMACGAFGLIVLPSWPVDLWTAWASGAYRGGAGLAARGYMGLGELGLPGWVFLPLAGYVIWRWWRDRLTAPVLGLAISTGLLLTPYSRSYDHVLLLLPVMAGFARARGWQRAVVWALALAIVSAPLIRLEPLAPVLAAGAALLTAARPAADAAAALRVAGSPEPARQG